jgi:phosphoglucosamine mutase
VRAIEAELRQDGRVVLRASGTEPVIRVMLEGRDEKVIRLHAERLAQIVSDAAAA